MQYELPGTLARLVGSPYRNKRLVAVTAQQFGRVLLGVGKSDSPALPDSEAVRFYALNQMMSQLFQQFTTNEKLPEWAAEIAGAYERELAGQHQRLVWYTFLVTSREFRHLKNPQTAMADKMFSAEFKALQPKLSDSTDDLSLNKWLKLCPAESLEHYCRCMTHGFDHGNWGGGYGGKPWGNIARTLAECMGGNTSPEVFIDTAYTLAHNNGPMFNKGMFYHHYSNYFKTILDIQRAGMVCEGLFSQQLSGWVVTQGLDDLLRMIKNVRDNLGGIGDYIDWYKVEELGALGTYGSYKSQQDKKYGKKPEKTLVGGKPVKMTGAKFEVLPNVFVPIYERLSA